MLCYIYLLRTNLEKAISDQIFILHDFQCVLVLLRVKSKSQLVHNFKSQQICFQLLVYFESCICVVVYEQSIKACVLVLKKEKLLFQVPVFLRLKEVLSRVLLNYVGYLIKKSECKGFNAPNQQ